MPTPPPLEPAPAKPGVVLILVTVLLVALNMFLAFGNGMRKSGDVSYSMGSVFGAALLPLLVTAIFSISKKNRNPRAQTRIILTVALLQILINLANLGKQLSDSPA